MFSRRQALSDRGNECCFLWGPRQTGKSTLLRQIFPDSPYYDLLRAADYERLARAPETFRQEVLALGDSARPVVVDEVQKLPSLLDEVHALSVETGRPFVLCGSSPRKLLRGGGNLLGGRALRYELFPLVFPEIPEFDLLRALNHGLLPRHYLARQPRRMLQAFVGDYLRNEIAAEGVVRRLPAFARFLDGAALTNGEIVRYENIARESGVSGPTVREYFQVLVDTLLGRFVPAFTRRPKRRVIQAPRFYLFDVGVVGFLARRGTIQPRSELFGRAFEHFIFQELVAHAHYSGTNYSISYWRTASGIEVDFVLGDGQVALEVKGTDQVAGHYLRGLQAFREEYSSARALLVSLAPRRRQAGDALILPWRDFLEMLWADQIL